MSICGFELPEALTDFNIVQTYEIAQKENKYEEEIRTGCKKGIVKLHHTTRKSAFKGSL